MHNGRRKCCCVVILEKIILRILTTYFTGIKSLETLIGELRRDETKALAALSFGDTSLVIYTY